MIAPRCILAVQAPLSTTSDSCPAGGGPSNLKSPTVRERLDAEIDAYRQVRTTFYACLANHGCTCCNGTLPSTGQYVDFCKLLQDGEAFAKLEARVQSGRHRELSDQELARLEANRTMLTPAVRQ